MKKLLQRFGIGLAAVATSVGLAQQEPQLGQPDQSEQGVPFSELPWPIKLGARSAMLSSQVTHADRVVLVPDLPTWLDEVGRWKPLLRWPVLLEDDLYTPLFVRAYKPKELIRRAPVKREIPETAEERQKLADAIMLQAWGGDPNNQQINTIDGVYRTFGWVPQGIVATAFDDPAWPAALALAIGRGQLLRTLVGKYGSANDTANSSMIDRIERNVEQLFSESGWTWKTLGDDLDALTLCREMPVRADTPLPNSMRVQVSGVNRGQQDTAVALTDLLCRDSNGARFAICSWIWGDQIRSVYMAMCSLFLNRDSVLLVNSYPQGDNWRAYSITEAGNMLTTKSYTVPGVHIGDSANIAAWRRLVSGGPQADVLIFNSSGNSRDMTLANSTKGTTHDIPALSRPLALHMIHSFSLQSPDDTSTIGGRWLQQGVYAYVGSCEEPYLQAFTPPKALVERIINFVPFMVASRTLAGEMSKPWRVVTIGDPLMLLEPPEKRTQKRSVVNIPLLPGDTSIRESALQSLRGDALDVKASTLHDLQLLSQDELARKLWERMLEEGTPTAEQAKAMLPLFFQQRDATSFMNAYRIAGEPGGQAREMLWTLFLPRIDSIRSVSDLVTLQRSLRSGLAADDLASLLPQITRRQGPSQRRAAITRALEAADNERDLQGLRALLNEQPK